MNRKSIAMFALVLTLAVGASGLLHAATSVFIYETGDFEYRGQWISNGASSASVKIRVANPDTVENEFVRVVVKARATDGTQVQGSSIGQVLARGTKDFTITLPKAITSLTLIQILQIPTND
jgi:hypothetical protein